MVERILKALTSLRLTVVCLACALILVLVGTLAQVNEGLYQAQTRYFRSFFILWSPGSSSLRLPVFPGGYLVGIVLLANLIAAHTKRFGLTRKKAGVLMIHGGLILLLIGQIFTDLLSQESTMSLTRGGSSDYSEDLHLQELVVVDKTEPKSDEVVAIPERMLAPKGEIRHPGLPVAVRVKEFWPNADLSLKSTNGALSIRTSRGVGTNGVFVLPKPTVTDPDMRNTPAAIVELLAPDVSLGSWLVSPLVKVTQPFIHANRFFEVGLRIQRYYKPFSLTLLDLRHEIYKGTDIPRNFSSRVRIRNPQTAEDREVLIYMNNPLRYRGEDVLPIPNGNRQRPLRAPGGPEPQLADALLLLHPGWAWTGGPVHESFIRLRQKIKSQ